MARKKRKAGPPPPSRRSGRGHSFAPFPPPACGAPIWPHLWTLLAAGLALRLIGGLSSDWIYREDEVMQYLEPAHRLLFGSGFLTWEQRYGVRNLLTAAPAMGLMTLCDSIGRGPDCYIPALAAFNAVFSMALPVALYFLARRLYDETAGRVALTMGCFWYTFVAFAPRLMIEQISAIFLFSGLALAPPLAQSGWTVWGKSGAAETEPSAPVSALRLWAVGFLIGLSGFIRIQYAPVAALLGILLLLRLPPRLAPHLIGGSVLALALTGAADWAVWGVFFHSVFAYLETAPLFLGKMGHGEASWHNHIVRMTVCSAGLWALVFIAAAADWRRHWPALGAVLILLVVHGAVNSFSYSHIFLALPFMTLALGGVFARPPGFLRGVLSGNGKFAAAGVAALISLGGAAHLLPKQIDGFWSTVPPIPAGESRRLFFQNNPLLSAARHLSRLPPEEVRAVLWTSRGPLWTGGYFYLHHNVPYWHGWLESHRETIANTPPEELASHIAAPYPKGAEWARAAGFKEIANIDGTRIFENPNPDKVRIPEKFSLGLGRVDDDVIDREMARIGKDVPEAPFLSFPPE